MSVEMPKMTQNDFDRLSRPMELDLEEYYRLLYKDVDKIINNPEYSGNDMIKEIERIL